MQKPIQDLSPRISACLKVIYNMQERGQNVSTSAVRERLAELAEHIIVTSENVDKVTNQ